MPAHQAPLLLPVLVPSLTTLEQLAEQGITTERGLLICNKCSEFKVVDLDIQHTFEILFQFFLQLGNQINFFSLQDGSGDLKPEPLHIACDKCISSKSMRPVIGNDDATEFNSWLFLLLGRFMGSVDGAQLVRLFPDNQYVGSRTKLLFNVCIGLLSQLDPVRSQQLLFLYQMP
ncbi:hypothetical protein FRX31_023977 [Thalictrum thalictroides]|uniref:DUF7086 domain-containing protein n=1 Tax=Thalictrum thalictroides TaxID=46969 RepID=A0A7J6VMV6_THATH|nr:hypothetical protein FRX31_023977 [Thalictrum thalictroides]